MCDENCRFIKGFIQKIHDPLFVELTGDFQQMFKSCRTDARTCYRRASSNGYSVRKENKPDPVSMFEIWSSSDIRQNRPINLKYETIEGRHFLISNTAWPITDYGGFCDKHNLEMYICYKDDMPVAYLELLNSNGLSIVHSTMGHQDHLKFGIMKFLFLEVFRLKRDMKYLVYGGKDSIEHPSFSFKKDLGILKYGQAAELNKLSFL